MTYWLALSDRLLDFLLQEHIYLVVSESESEKSTITPSQRRDHLVVIYSLVQLVCCL